ncbi:MAG: Iron binding protein IscA for iron-sulfur cluster assembly [Labilithrix sp.]|nr:Iron binding protein IscA for iron-sulfur cluster assembly [Labilithrix sp.]
MNETTTQHTTTAEAATSKPSEHLPASKRLAISITQSAVDAIGAQIAKRGIPGTALRVGIRGGGCSGFSYVIEFHDGEPRARDIVYDMKATSGSDVRVVVDKKSLLYLNGATLDWEKTLLRQGFKFINPNEKASCGCGTSFTV